MRVQMRIQIGGYRDGEAWPPPGGVVKLTDQEAADLIASGYATQAPDPQEGTDEETTEDGNDPAAEQGDPDAGQDGDEPAAENGNEQPRPVTKAPAKKAPVKKAPAKKPASG